MSAASSGLLQKLTARSDIALAILLVAIIFMMIMPMPTLIVDVLIATNMGLAILLLMLSVYLPSPLHFSSFPSVLLLTTLFRLSLSIATTRLILTEADAGKIIETFGQFVVGGNMVVGIVIFLIITIVQFIVITKGSERIAEVGARFSLDAMPGKQMSIDSDLRAGVISLTEARSRRLRLEKESQLFGSMDGAMKFVKGDAIAGLIIILVNILGGITIGVVQRGMAAGDAAQLYSVLTIGDGLISQIPALFISITAGIIISRVTVDDDSNLGTDISGQLLDQPNALMVAAVIVTMMGFIPGFPTMVFLILGAILGFTGFMLNKAKSKREFAVAEATTILGGAEKLTGGGADAYDSTKLLEELKPLDPVLVEIPETMRSQIPLPMLNDEFTKVRRQFYTDLGVPLSGVGLRLSEQLSGNLYRILIRGIPVAQGDFSAPPMAALPKASTAGAGSDMAVVNTVNTPADTGAGSQAIRTVSSHLSFVLRRHAAEFVGVQEVHTLMSRLEEAGYVTLVQEAQRAVPNTKMVDVFKRLLSESISIRDLRQILETLIEFAEEKDMGMLTERVRIGLKRQIAYSFTRGTGQLPVYMIDPESERLLQGSIRQTQAGIFLALAPDIAQNLFNTVRYLEEQYNQRASPDSVRPVVLAGMDLRRHLRTHLATQFPDLPVLAIQELPPTISVQPAGELRLTQPPPNNMMPPQPQG
ncbi:type III secretion system export apparatus subunit SctV [Thiofilum flexile]|uniref:type III secretion system export apparatus subunit SctV n=1 Tax=Thiofilum flexile TaxID=125627 RepID=UPI00037EEDE5|nr:type III secretion system export apparatus subunit SctV [Thiofilum flexile]